MLKYPRKIGSLHEKIVIRKIPPTRSFRFLPRYPADVSLEKICARRTNFLKQIALPPGERGGRADKYTSGTLIKSRNVCRSLVSLILSAARTQTLSARKDVLVQFLLEVCWSLTPQRLIPGRSSRARVQERIYFCDVANPKVAVTLLVLMDESQAFRISFSGLRECQIRIKLCGCTYVCGRITYNATHLAFY